jgi:hypothetical protein
MIGFEISLLEPSWALRIFFERLENSLQIPAEIKDKTASNRHFLKKLAKFERQPYICWTDTLRPR